ncbi:hypothetical protein Tsubulata_017010 [Turnera subulata]|uniref:Uncharacterized protein n=1 Tax=Turnera subulata TaxID=218843 RepID=A0A9Q0FHY2_9ROSI|nr:hypothetical protein Tsubulata_017010 [Turnera subulata]
MNFLLRPGALNVMKEKIQVPESAPEPRLAPKPGMTLEGLIAEDSFPQSPVFEDRPLTADEALDGLNSSFGGRGKNDSCLAGNYLDVSEQDGWVTIPYRQLPDDWNTAPDIHSLRSLDRPFVFPGEQIHILACLSAYKQDTEIITPFKVAAVMSKNGIGKSPEQQNGNGNGKDGINLASAEGEVCPKDMSLDQNGNDKQKAASEKDISDTESILRMEDHRRQTEMLLQRFNNSHFFVRIAESGESLWSKRAAPISEFAEMVRQSSTVNGTRRPGASISPLNVLIDKGDFDLNVSGGAARNSVRCCSLSNGDIVVCIQMSKLFNHNKWYAYPFRLLVVFVLDYFTFGRRFQYCDLYVQTTDSLSISLSGRMQVLLQVNVGVTILKDPVIEILQFEKHQERNLFSRNEDSLNYTSSDPCGELLRWLLPLENTLPPPARSLTPPRLNSGSVAGNAPNRPSSGSQLLSHFRSYSMSSIPQNSAPPTQPLKAQSSKPTFDIQDWEQEQYSSQKSSETKKAGEGLLSFRGVSLEHERFSVRCGLEGIYIPGRRWRRKLEIIQPVEIHSFAADCNTDDLLCVQIKNVSPAHTPDIVVYIDAITVIIEEASKGGSPSSLPIACIEAGNDHSLPNLALRRGEEHSFILKPASSLWKNLKIPGEKISSSSRLLLPPNTIDQRNAAHADKFAIMVSCRCNYTESRLFFKHPTSWRPRISRDLMISVASGMSGQSSGPSGKASQLPVQVLTLQASNLTSEDLTMTVLAPASFTAPPSVGSLGSSPTTPISSLVVLPESPSIANGERDGGKATFGLENQKQNVDGGVIYLAEQSSPLSDVIPSTGFGCTHLWLQSRVPLGCVPAHSTATIKLELLPLTDGIIKLDTLQIDVKEKGLTYVPEHSLKINATSSITTGIV